MTPLVSHRRSSCALAAVLLLATSSSAFAAQTDITISMDKAAATPRINGAAVIGSIPGSPFLHTLSVTG